MKNVDYQLRQFIEVAKHKSLSDAAITLNVTQSALSKQLREIETVVGHPVFRRHGRGVVLTEQGDALLQAAQMAYHLIDTTIGKIREERPFRRGTLKVATIQRIARFVVNEVIGSLLDQRPDIDIEMMEGSSGEVLRMVDTGAADIGFVERGITLPRTLKATDLNGFKRRVSRSEAGFDATTALKTESRSPDSLRSRSADSNVVTTTAFELTVEHAAEPDEGSEPATYDWVAVTKKSEIQVVQLLATLTRMK
jgi:DNA-binding transcriptional LysR family regulator